MVESENNSLRLFDLVIKSETMQKKIQLSKEDIRETKPSRDQYLSQPKTPLIIVLDNVTNSYNVGAFIRLADAFAIEKIIVCGELTISDKIQIEGDIKCHWSLGKDDVTPEEIFAAQRGSDDDRARVGKYCIMDVVLCLELMNKLRIVTNNVGMSNVCTTPLSWIFRRGQGIKILSLVSKECRDKGYLLPTLFPDTYGDDSYEGAIVLTPYPGIYLDDEPVSVLDYASLYPNSMRANNLSHETLVKDEKWLGDKGKVLLKSLGYNCVDITYDNYKGAKDKKVKTGICHVRFVQPKNNKFGIIPSILKNLLTARKLNRTRIVHKKYNNHRPIFYIFSQ